MGVIRNADAGVALRSAVALDLADVARVSERVRVEAEAEAMAVLSRASADADRMMKEARESGHREGFAEGIADGYQAGLEQGRAEALAAAGERIERLVNGWAGVMSELEAARAGMVAAAKREVIELAVVVAERVTKRAVEVDGGVLGAQIVAALSAMASGSRVRVMVSPGDVELAREVMPGLMGMVDGLEHAEIVADGSIGPGGCVVRGGSGGVVDATIMGQLERVIAVAMPGARVGAGRVGRGGAGGEAGGADEVSDAGEASDVGDGGVGG